MLKISLEHLYVKNKIPQQTHQSYIRRKRRAETYCTSENTRHFTGYKLLLTFYYGEIILSNYTKILKVLIISGFFCYYVKYWIKSMSKFQGNIFWANIENNLWFETSYLELNNFLVLFFSLFSHTICQVTTVM